MVLKEKHRPIEEQMKRHESRIEAKKLKRLLTLLGYTYQVSFYGIARNIWNNEANYRRIEVLLNQFPTEEVHRYLYEFFGEVLPEATYTIWSYDMAKDDLTLKGEFE